MTTLRIPSRRRAQALKPARSQPAAGFRRFRILTSVADAGTGADEAQILCPWLRGLAPDDGLFLSALPIHDCNAFVDDDKPLDLPPSARERFYLGVFALDRLRQTEQLLARLRDKGVERIINLPTVSFFDGATERAFAALGFTLDAEIAFLEQAQRFGFGVALCSPAGNADATYQAASFDFTVRHHGPGMPLTFDAKTA